jgi:hypothetical protein
VTLPRALLLILALALLFTVANRGAYQGYWNDDDLDNLSWTRYVCWSTSFAQAIVTPQASAANFRPVGHAFYKAYGALFGLYFPPAIAFLHLLHLFNILLLWAVLRKLGATPLAAGAGCLFFAFPMAVFDAFWKPMFVFDLFCVFFLLAALLLYLYDHWLAALIPFWLAYKSKELAVTFVVLLLLYELMLGGRRWRRTLPFLIIAASFSLQAVFINQKTDNGYTLRFTTQAFFTCLVFYCSKVFLVPYAGFLLVPVALLVKDSRVRFALAAFPLLLGPLLFLPGRLFAVYLYWPMVALAIAVAFLAQNRSLRTLALFFVPWLLFNFLSLREQRRAALTIAHENRAFVDSLAALYPRFPDARVVIYDPRPTYMNKWGVEGVVKWFWPAKDTKVYAAEDLPPGIPGDDTGVLLVTWDRVYHKMTPFHRAPGDPLASRIVMDTLTPRWQLLEGWGPLEYRFRWTQPRATARLHVPPGATVLEVGVNVGPVQVHEGHKGHLEVIVEGRSLGAYEYSAQGWQTHSWPLPPNLPETVTVELKVDPPFRETMGLAITSLAIR